MAKYLEWYLVELEKRLDPATSPEVAFELLNQAEDHLGMIKQEFMMAGMDEVQAEQAAIRRFGDLDGYGTAERQKSIVRANWAAPVLILIGGTVVVCASMLKGSADAMMEAAVLGIAALVLSALLCCRRGRFPGLAFGILLAACFAAASVIASIEFYGPRLDFVRKDEKAQLVSLLQQVQANTEKRQHLMRLGFAWSDGKLGSRVPNELRSPAGIIVPLTDRDFSSFFDQLQPEFIRLKGLERLFGIPGMRLERYAVVPHMPALRHYDDALARWKMVSAQDGMDSYQWRSQELSALLATLTHEKSDDTENLFAGALFGSLVSGLWMLIAFVLNRLANINLSGVHQTHQKRVRVARS